MSEQPVYPGGVPGYAFPPRVVPDYDAQAKRIAAVLQEAWDRVEAEKDRLFTLVEGDARWPRIKARLDEYQQEIRRFQSVAADEAEHLVTLVTGQYANGMTLAAATTGMAVPWTPAHQQVVALLAADTYSDLLERSYDAGRVSDRLVRTIRRVAREEMPFQATGGKTARDVGRAMRRRLEDEFRIGTVAYRDGSVHSIKEYTEMLARTKGRVAQNSGSINAYSEMGIEYLEVFDGGSCGWTSHRDVDKANGTIRTVDACAAHLISHPNCRRTFGPRPDVTAANLANAKPMQDLQPYIDEAYEQALLEDAARRERAARGPAPITTAQDPLASLPRIAGGPDLYPGADVVNPGHVVGADWRSNCHYVVPTTELRARGYDVIARPTHERTGRYDFEIARDWQTADGKTREFTRLVAPMSGDRRQIKTLLREHTADWPDGARGFVSGSWKSGGGHIFNVEKRGGSLRFYEQQVSASADDYVARMKRDTVAILRTDDLVPTQRLLNVVAPATPERLAELRAAAGDGWLVGAAAWREERDTIATRLVHMRQDIASAHRAAAEEMAAPGTHPYASFYYQIWADMVENQVVILEGRMRRVEKLLETT